MGRHYVIEKTGIGKQKRFKDNTKEQINSVISTK